MINPLFALTDHHTVESAHLELKSTLVKILAETMRSDFKEAHRAGDIHAQEIVKDFVIQLVANAYIIDVASQTRDFYQCEVRKTADRYFRSSNLCDAITYVAMGVHQTFADRQENTNA